MTTHQQNAPDTLPYLDLRKRLASRNRGLRDKVTSLSEAIATIQDGDHVAIGGNTFSRTPFAAIWEIVRQQKKHLTVSRSITSTEGDFLLAGGCVDKYMTSWFSQGIVWDKQHPVLTRKDFMGCFELAFYGWKEGAAHQFFGPNNALDLWHVKKVNPQNMQHLTEKPVELAIRASEYSSRPGENVLDLFGGSGSTLIAAERTGRQAFLMEIDPLYVDVIVARFEQHTGRKAERAA